MGRGDVGVLCWLNKRSFWPVDGVGGVGCVFFLVIDSWECC